MCDDEKYSHQCAHGIHASGSFCDEDCVEEIHASVILTIGIASE